MLRDHEHDSAPVFDWSAAAESSPEIVFCDECPDFALGRVDDTPLCLSCMLARLRKARALRSRTRVLTRSRSRSIRNPYV
jgi:hypothetical protein